MKHDRTFRFLGVAALATVCVTAVSVPAGAVPSGTSDYRMSHAQARSILLKAGYAIDSTGKCSAKNNPNCTSLEKIWRHTVDGAVTLRKFSGCRGLVITGGTEVGHAGTGRGTHVDGWKLDFRLNSCLEGYVRRNFRYVGDVRWGLQWKSPSGNVYTKERKKGRFDHWDVLYWNCGNC